MRAAHGVVLVFVLALAGLGSVLLTGRESDGTEDPARPDRGALAPFDGDVPRLPVARLPGSAGRVVDVAGSGDLLAVLTRDHWYLHSPAGLRGGFGDPIQGAPEWLARPVAIAVADGEVYVLEAGRHRVSVWDTAGVRRQEIGLETGREISLQPEQLLVDARGRVVVVTLAVEPDGSGRWEATAYGQDGAVETLLSHASDARSVTFARPHLALRGEDLIGVGALDHAYFEVTGGGHVRPFAHREAAPLWRVPARHRRSYDAVLTRLTGAHATLSALPDHWPSVRGLAVRADGSLLVAVTAGEEHLHIEQLTPDARPVRRFGSHGFTDPVFLADGRAFLVEETEEEVVIHEFLPESP